MLQTVKTETFEEMFGDEAAEAAEAVTSCWFQAVLSRLEVKFIWVSFVFPREEQLPLILQRADFCRRRASASSRSASLSCFVSASLPSEAELPSHEEVLSVLLCVADWTIPVTRMTPLPPLDQRFISGGLDLLVTQPDSRVPHHKCRLCVFPGSAVGLLWQRRLLLTPCCCAGCSERLAWRSQRSPGRSTSSPPKVTTSCLPRFSLTRLPQRA